jgi:hypothetical protein
MERERFTNDQVDQVLSQLFSGLVVFHAQICAWLIEADVSQQFLADGARDLAQWVSARFDLRHSTAGQLVRVSRRLRDLPLLRERFAAGEISLDQVDAISKLATPSTEEALIAECAGLSNAALDRAARTARQMSIDDERSVWERRHLGFQWNLDESELCFDGSLPGAEGKLFEASVRGRADGMPENPETGMFDSYPARLADSVVELATAGGASSSTNVQVTLFADFEALIEPNDVVGVAELAAGPVIANETARRLSCDAVVECVVTDHRRVLGIGRRSRLIPAWLRRQLWFRDGGCRFPGCPERHFVHGHHRQHWSRGGPTDLDNLILLCGYHHRFVHEHGWKIETNPDGLPLFRRPDDEVYPPRRPPPHPRILELAGRRT